MNQINIQSPKVRFIIDEDDIRPSVSIYAIAKSQDLQNLDINPLHPFLMNVKAGAYRIVSRGIFIFDPDTSEVSVVLDWNEYTVAACEDPNNEDFISWH